MPSSMNDAFYPFFDQHKQALQRVHRMEGETLFIFKIIGNQPFFILNKIWVYIF